MICFQALILAYLYSLYWCGRFSLHLIIIQLRVAAERISGSFLKIALGLDGQSPRIDSGRASELSTAPVFGKPGAKPFGGINRQNAFSFHKIKLIFTSWDSGLCFGFPID